MPVSGARYCIALVATLTGCGRSICEDAVGRGDGKEVVEVCTREFDASGAPDAAAAAARAHLKLGDDERAMALAERLIHGPHEAEGHRLAGEVNLGKDSFDAARRELEAALRLHTHAGDHRGACLDAQLIAHLDHRRTDYRDALRMAELAQAEAAAAADDALVASSLVVMGRVVQDSGDDERALAIYDQAESLMPLADKESRAQLLNYRAVALVNRGLPALAAPLYEKARALAVERRQPLLTMSADINLADIALRQHRFDVAEQRLDSAGEAWRAAGRQGEAYPIGINRGILSRQQGDTAAALRHFDAAMEHDPPPDWRWRIAHERGLALEAKGQIDKAEGRYQEAMDIVEDMRRSAPESMKAPLLENRWQPYESMFALRTARGDARGAFAILLRAQGRMFLDAFITSTADLPVVRGATATAQGAIARIDVVHGMASVLPAQPDVDTTLDRLRGHHVLVFFFARGQLRLIVLERGEPRIAGLAIDRAQLDRQVGDFLARPDDPALAAALGAALVPPDALPRDTTRIHVVPVGPLLQVPFAALRSGGTRLLDRYEIVYAPSVTGLAALAIARGGGSPGPALALADSRGDLGHAKEEVAFVASATGARALIGAAATTDELRGASEASLLHVAGHAGVGTEGGYLLLADGSRVTAAEILAWRLRPRLVVLAGCASAATIRSEMWDSLAAAFLAAGSRHVVATLGAVDDSVAAQFAQLFYRDRWSDDPIGAAARAQRDMALHRSAADWSLFVVAGL